MFFKGVIAGNNFITENLLTGLTRDNADDPQNYCVADSTQELCNKWAVKFNVRTTTNPIDFVGSAAFLILACHHDDLDGIMRKIAHKIKRDTLVLSAMHRTKIADIEKYLPNHQIIRLVLNPSVVSGAGVGAYAANKNATVDAKSAAQIIIKNLGSMIEVNNEAQLEKMRDFILANTFLSYLTVKSMVDAGRKIGLSTKDAGFIAEKILSGATQTLVEDRQRGIAMLQQAYHKEILNEAIGLIKEYGIYDSVDKILTKDDFIDPEPPKSNVHYQWLNK